MTGETRWYLKPLKPVFRDWKAKVDPRNAGADRSAHTSLVLLLQEPFDLQRWTPGARAADLDAIARALEPRITELQHRRMEGQK